LIARADRVIVDLGTGDGRAVLAQATADPRALVIGIDAAATSMAQSSRRVDRRGPPSAVFLAAGVEALAESPLAGRADLVTAFFPWGSLLRGILGLDRAALCGLAAVARPGATLSVLLSIVPSDHVPGLDCLDEATSGPIADAWRTVGLTLHALRPASLDEVRASGSSWARRLGPDRPVWRLEGSRSGIIAR
jgi:16S rRNA (adenine(1408)-N(1))-methyltransferase